ncbi:uncharacterized protein K452DRAFT_18081 [Aplosporella prunicola CBS 121167]|uniref:RGS domain-containing protein n=1 Tax=Aplosporella prunicola CBS 121167 TaxID=1176127 RepID=A0A6A6BE12_9PEZI|nr:uncharacterized protein K452DRAFT_18081 [Aplosporella prunicola CBS 121167]KAF2142400.1 hypothetical protein K452DRAFT_18081 [Aplosporella prunicola CBS 121167]
MSNSRRTAPPSLHLDTSSTDSSRSASPFEDFEKDAAEMRMSSQDGMHSKPLTVSIPRQDLHNSYSPRRPNLSEILANTASPPWTLSAFMAYLSQNHCLETLEFTMDASRYRKHYNKMTSQGPASPVSPTGEECNYVKMLWQRLLDAYIVPNGPREVNLPSDVRDSLLSQSNPYAPPHPSALDPAVAKIYELMEESVLVPFLNSISPQSADSANNASEENLHQHTRSCDERTLYYHTSRREHDRPHVHRASAPSSLTTSFSNVTRNFGAAAHARFASSSHHKHPLPHSTASSAVGSPSDRECRSGPDALTDDSGSVSSPSAMGDPMTPPTTPPMSEFVCPTSGGTPSPRHSRHEREGSGWKRVSSKLGWKKKSGGQLRDEHNQHSMDGGMF